MPQPTVGDVHINRPLTNMSVGFVQDADGFVALSVLLTFNRLKSLNASE